jgi:large subunit ribosomal protein L9
MKIILKETIANLGQEGDVVNVKPGYGRNYLIPQGMATLATPGALRMVENQREAIRLRAEQAVGEAKALASRIESTSVTLSGTTGTSGRIFGSITNKQIADALAEKGIEIDRRKIHMPDEMRHIGEYKVEIDILGDIRPSLTVHVVGEGTEEEEA